MLNIASEPFLPHGFCYQWKPALIWLHVASDVLIALAYFAIPLILLYFAKKRRDAPFRWVFLCFGVFISACGATHVMEVVTLWVPAYWTSGAVKLITALASLPTAILVAKILPGALALPTTEQMRLANLELQKQTRALKESEDLYRDLVENSQDLICTHDLEGMLLSINEAPLRILGYSREEMLNKPLRDFVTPEAQAHCDEYLSQIRKDGFAKGVLPVLTKDGQVRWWEYNNTVRKDGPVPIVRGMAHDITEQRRAEKALRLSEEKFSKAFQASPVEIAITTLAEGRFIEVNPTVERQTGFNREEMIGRTSLEIGLWVDPSERAKIIEEIKLGHAVKDREIKLRTKSGEVRVSLYSTQPLTIGREECLLTVCEDITARKNAEEALRVSQERFRLMADNIEEIFWLLNPKTLEAVYVSPAFETICERPVESIRENPVSYREIIHPDDRQHVLEQLALLAQTGKFFEEFRIVCPSGSVKWIEANGFVAKGSSGDISALVGTAQEITARKHVEEHLRRVQKMEAIGLLASGIAHDFNNVLTGILGYGQLLEKSSDQSERNRDRASNIVEACLQGRELTGKLLAFSRDETSPMEVISIDAEIRRIEDMVRRLIGEHITVEIALDSKSLGILAERKTVSQIILNLAANARDAMRTGGTLSIQTSATIVHARHFPVIGIPDDRYVVLRVKDTGCGMDKATLDRIFEPFFTTKASGEGTGLGLYTVYAIVRQCSGHIRVHSEVGRGTAFTIYFPVAHHESPEVSATEHTPSPASQELIMVVEDNLIVREMLSDQLRDSGYNVLCKANGPEALQAIESSEQKIALLLTDVVMPEMNGVDLVRRLRQKQPGLKALFITGWTPKEMLPSDALGEDSQLLAKPFTTEQLKTSICRMLRHEGTGSTFAEER